MSRLVQMWELNSEEQDNLWIDDRCPFCGAKIVSKNLTVDIAFWNCRFCDVEFVCE